VVPIVDRATRELNANWPKSVPLPSYWLSFSLLDVAARIESGMRYASSGRTLERFPEFCRLDRTEGLTEMVRR
jgi:hypothetical protein